MNAEQAIRFIAHEAKRCHDRDAHESLCLLLPSILNGLQLTPMHYTEALDFTIELRQSIREQAHVKTGTDPPFLVAIPHYKPAADLYKNGVDTAAGSVNLISSKGIPPLIKRPEPGR